MGFIVIIPSRFASTRLPQKPLADINGKPMVIRVMEQAQASGANRVIVATDNLCVVDVVNKYNGEACLTSIKHQSGTERLCEVVDYYDFPEDQIIVNVQVDEPIIPPYVISQVVDNLINLDSNNIATTLAVPILTIEEAFNPNIVKVVLDASCCALYFSRAVIPWNKHKIKRDLIDKSKIINYYWLRHIGIYAYCVSFIRQYSNWDISPLEQIENLEQLRILWYGKKIHVSLANSNKIGIGIDTQEDLTRIRSL